jgi:hypothetical protein
VARDHELLIGWPHPPGWLVPRTQPGSTGSARARSASTLVFNTVPPRPRIPCRIMSMSPSRSSTNKADIPARQSPRSGGAPARSRRARRGGPAWLGRIAERRNGGQPRRSRRYRGPQVVSISCCASSKVIRPAQTSRCRRSSSRSLTATSDQAWSHRLLDDVGCPPSPSGIR